MIGAGTLDRKITIQRKTTVQDSSGEPVETWIDLSTNRWASVMPVVGSEVIGVEQIRARQQVDFRVRWSQDIADLNALDRIIYPVAAATNSPSQDNTVYDIVAVNEIGRHEGLKITAARQPDVPT